MRDYTSSLSVAGSVWIISNQFIVTSHDEWLNYYIIHEGNDSVSCIIHAWPFPIMYILNVMIQKLPLVDFNNYNTSAAGYGTVTYDIGYGGAFYALVDAHQLQMDLRHTPIHQLVQAADAITTAVKETTKIKHPESADLAFLYGTILTDGKDQYSASDPTANLCVFAECEVRSTVMF